MSDPADDATQKAERGSYVSAGDVAERAGVSRSAVSRTFSEQAASRQALAAR